MSELQDSEVRLPDEVVSTPVAYESFNDGKDLQRALSTRQVAQWLRVSESEVERLATTGELPARKLAGAWRFGAVALNRWIEVNSDPRTTPEPVVEKVEQLSAQWRDLSTRLEKVLEPVIGTDVVVASDGGVSFSGELVTIEQLEKAYILYALARNNGSKSATAPVLGIDPATLYRKLKDY